MNVLLQSRVLYQATEIKITGSKSETNRWLLLQEIFPNIVIENSSNADDSELLRFALSTTNEVINIQHAGTAMRFLTAHFAIQEGRTVILSGSPRMKERPIKILVDALRHLGAKIEYLENEGFPPIKITGQRLNNNKVALPASVSSQYISALLLIAPELENGLELSLIGEITSISYLKMTLALLNEIGIETSFETNNIVIKPKLKTINPQSIFVESDWSSASYYYSIIALSPVGTKITLATFKQNSLQGDRVLKEIYERMGVVTHFSDNKIQLEKKVDLVAESITLDLINTPDIAQTIAVTCFGLGIECHLSGLHTLKIKETDRLTALKTELTKLGALVSITENSLTLAKTSKINSNCVITTYNDHRMAMAFAPLALKTDLIIENADVVSKSYPDFWTDLNRWCFKISEV